MKEEMSAMNRQLAAIRREQDMSRAAVQDLGEKNQNYNKERRNDFVREKELLKRVVELDMSTAGFQSTVEGLEHRLTDSRMQTTEEADKRLRVVEDVAARSGQEVARLRRCVESFDNRQTVETVAPIRTTSTLRSPNQQVLPSDLPWVTAPVTAKTIEQGDQERTASKRKATAVVNREEVRVAEEDYFSHEERVALSRRRRLKRQARKEQANGIAAGAPAAK